MTAARSPWLLAAPVLFLLLWSGGYAVAKVGLQYTGPMTLLVLRYGCVVVLMGVAFAVMRPPLPATGTEWGHLAFVGFLIQTVYFGMAYVAFGLGVAAGTAALVMSLQPVLVALVAPRWTRERVGWRNWGGLVLALAGTGIVIAARSVVEAPSVAGFGFALVALAGITAGTLWEKRFGLAHHPVTANLIGYAAGLAGVVPLALALEDMRVEWTGAFAASLAYLVIGNSVVAVGLLLAMIRAGEVSKVSALLFLVPPGAAVIAWLLLGEAMPPLAWPGMALAGAGVWIAMRGKRAA